MTLLEGMIIGEVMRAKRFLYLRCEVVCRASVMSQRGRVGMMWAKMPEQGGRVMLRMVLVIALLVGFGAWTVGCEYTRTNARGQKVKISKEEYDAMRDASR